MKANQSNLLVIDGGVVKTEAEGVVAGYGIVFSSEAEPDSSKMRDFFTKESFVRRKESFTVPLYYEHGLGLIDTEIGEATLTKEDNGWKAVAEIDTSNEIGKTVYEAVKNKPHGFSTGALQHLVRRESKSNNTNFLKSWVVGELSLTERPAEPKAIVETIKSVDGAIEYEDAFPVEKPIEEVKCEKCEQVKTETGCGCQAAAVEEPVVEPVEETVLDLLESMEKSVSKLKGFASKDLTEGFEARFFARMQDWSKGEGEKVSELQAQLKNAEEQLADLRTKLSGSEDALTKANQDIARLEILAGAKETIIKHKGI